MKKQKSKHTAVPPSILLLFDNEKLDLMKVLCLMNAFSIQSKKKRKVGEILFYYSLVNFNLIRLFDKKQGMHINITPSPNLYFRFQKKINVILLKMSHLQFIELKGDISKKLEDISVKLLPKGKQFFEEHNSEFFPILETKYTNAFNTIGFSVENVKVIKGVQH